MAGKVALITGAAHPRGQGAAEARRFVDEGAIVFLTDIDDERGKAAAAALGAQAAFRHLDVTDAAAWERVVAGLVAEQGRIDVLVNNAGVWLGRGLVDTTPEDYRRVVEINQTGVFLGMRAVAGPMRSAGAGSIVNVSSTAALKVTLPYWRPEDVAHAYTASKWAVRGMTKAAAYELARHGIRVNSVHPGVIDTPMIEGGHERLAAATPFGRLGQPDEVAEAVLFLASDEAAYISGAELTVDGAATA